MTEQEIRVEVEGHPLCGVLRTAWGLRSINDARQFVADVEVPGLLALRSRLLHLRDPEAASWEQPLRGAVAEAWVATLARETAAERALNANDTLLAEQLFDELLRNEHDDEYPITTVNALLGLADVARQRDSVETAASMYDKAIDVADRIGYRFGTSRALVALGYLALVASSANAAIAKFERAKAIAGPIGDRLGLANALLGIGECQQRLHQRDKAIEAIDESMEVSRRCVRPSARPTLRNVLPQCSFAMVKPSGQRHCWSTHRIAMRGQTFRSARQTRSTVSEICG